MIASKGNGFHMHRRRRAAKRDDTTNLTTVALPRIRRMTVAKGTTTVPQPHAHTRKMWSAMPPWHRQPAIARHLDKRTPSSLEQQWRPPQPAT
jgi:hypothetical protein